MDLITTEIKKKLIWRWSFVTGISIFLFWLIYYALVGSVPEVNSIKLTDQTSYNLPIAVSRWWDILIGPIWSTIFVFLFTSRRARKEENNFLLKLILGFIVGLGFGLAFGTNSYSTGIVEGLAVGLVCGLVLGFMFGLSISITLAFGLAAGLLIGLIGGISLGFAFGLVLGIIPSLVVGMLWFIIRTVNKHLICLPAKNY